MLIKRRRAQDESGAIALMYAFLLCFLLIPLMAFGFDLGNAIARKTNTQTQADFGAFAAAEQMTGTEAAGGTPTTAMVNAVAASLNANQPQDDGAGKGTCWRNNTCVTGTQLKDGDLTNGEVQYLSNGRVQVVAPNNRVQFGLAGAMGIDDATVAASATVKVKSVGLRVLPMFAVTGCDYGLQTLTDPAGGAVTPPAVPTLAFDVHENDTILESLQMYDSTNSAVDTVPVASTGNTMTLTARKWDKTLRVGFFRSDDPTASVIEQPVFWLNGDITATPQANTALNPHYTSNPTATVKFNIPAGVTSTEGIWYVRVFNQIATGNMWSPRDEAVPFRVGTPLLECTAGAVDGNFGTLIFPRNDVPVANNLAVNIVRGLQPPLTPFIHAGATGTGQCTDGVNGAVESYEPDVLREHTNCVDTDTGLPVNVATQGFITGVGGSQGLLVEPTRTGCDPAGGSDERSVRLGSPWYHINDDVLTCFFKDGSTSLFDVTNPAYAGGCAFINELIESPRFIQVPVLRVQPDAGGSSRYSIVDFRPGFITDEVPLPSSVRGTHSGTADNGMTITTSGITTIKVVFFARNAIDTCGDGMSLIDYLGVGPKIPVLTEVD